MSLVTQVSTLATRIGTEFKAVYAKVGTLTSLTTTAKSDLVSAINEVNAATAAAGAHIDDVTASGTTVYSSNKTISVVNAGVTTAEARANHTGTQTADTITDGTTNKAFLATERTKLAGIATGATANSTDAVLEARANHTGTQSADTLTDGTTNKAFLATERTKLTGIATGATANSTDATLLARANHTGTQLAATVSDFSTAADARITAQKGAANGIVPLDGTSKIAATYLPAYVDDVLEYTNLAAFPGTGTAGLIYVALDTNKIFRWSGSAYIEISGSPGSTDAVPEGSVNLYYTAARASAAAPVQSVAGRTGAVTLAKADVGLGNVDNTADTAKPVSTAQATAIGLKMDKSANLSDVANVATAQANLGVYSQTQIGDPTTDFVAVFNAALV